MPDPSFSIRVFYPAAPGELVLRSELDWGRDLEPVRLDGERHMAEFAVPAAGRAYLEYKPCLRRRDGFHWATGTNKLALRAAASEVYPSFFSGLRGRVTGRQAVWSRILGREVVLRVYLPAGHDENVLKRYPVLYVHDGKNLFFPDEAFLRQEWQLDETLDRLDEMSVIDQTIVVGVYSDDRQRDYTEPGVEAFGRALVEELKPWVDANLRTLTGASHTALLGSSLGGVAALHQAWTFPAVFGRAACLSSTFGHRDDLLARVRGEGRAGREGLRLYLDSGWPGDNYEATLVMATALIESGFVLGRDVVHLAFPLASHTELAWSARVHVPLQLFSGKLRRLADQITP